MSPTRITVAFAAALALAFSTAAHAAPAAPTQQIVIGQDGAQPSELTAKAGQPLKLVITRKTDATCVQAVVNKDLGISKPLPLNQPVTVEVAAPKAGTYRLACGMGMTFAVLKVQ